MYAEWAGQPNKPRYSQTIGYGSEFGGGEVKYLLDSEMLYLRPNPNTATPFGFGCLEIAFNSISRLLSVSEFAGNVAGNQRPSIGFDMPGVSPNELQAYRAFWRNEVEGTGAVPFFASHMSADSKTPGVNVLRLYPEGDKALFLKYQEMLQRELATAFDLSPQNFGIERDVNRNTSEVAEDRDWDQAIRPIAHDVAKSLTRHCIHDRLGFSQLRFRFRGMDREDEDATAQILERRYKINSITPNEVRARFDEPPSASPWADLYFADVEIAMQAARGAKAVLDDDLPKNVTPVPTPPKPAPAPMRAPTPTPTPLPQKKGT
jgi:hypothetical protein